MVGVADLDLITKVLTPSQLSQYYCTPFFISYMEYLLRALEMLPRGLTHRLFPPLKCTANQSSSPMVAQVDPKLENISFQEIVSTGTDEHEHENEHEHEHKNDTDTDENERYRGKMGLLQWYLSWIFDAKSRPWWVHHHMTSTLNPVSIQLTRGIFQETNATETMKNKNREPDQIVYLEDPQILWKREWHRPCHISSSLRSFDGWWAFLAQEMKKDSTSGFWWHMVELFLDPSTSLWNVPQAEKMEDTAFTLFAYIIPSLYPNMCQQRHGVAVPPRWLLEIDDDIVREGREELRDYCVPLDEDVAQLFGQWLQVHKHEERKKAFDQCITDMELCEI